MKHRDTAESVYINYGCYSSTIFEMELWSLEEDFQCKYSEEEFKEQLECDCKMRCGLSKESIGLFPSRERALEDLEIMYENPYEEDRELYAAFIRQRAMCCMMQPSDYLKEWTYVLGHLHDESIVRNFAEDENPFCGRPKEMIRFKRGDIVMIPDRYDGHWGIVCEVPVTIEHIKDVNDRIEAETGIRGEKYSGMD